MISGQTQGGGVQYVYYRVQRKNEGKQKERNTLMEISDLLRKGKTGDELIQMGFNYNYSIPLLIKSGEECVRLLAILILNVFLDDFSAHVSKCTHVITMTP